MNNSGNKSARQRGGALIEFAVTLPIFMMMLVGMLEYGYYFYVANSATAAAREGARQCTLVSLGKCGACNPTAAVAYMAGTGLDDYTTASATCATSAGTYMYTVDVDIDFPSVTGFLLRMGVVPESDRIEGYALARGVSIMRGQ